MFNLTRLLKKAAVFALGGLFFIPGLTALAQEAKGNPQNEKVKKPPQRETTSPERKTPQKKETSLERKVPEKSSGTKK